MRLACWGGAWLAATALMKFGPGALWARSTGSTLLVVALDVAAGVGMLLADKAYLAELDELQQRVYLNALAVTVGVALIIGIPYAQMGAAHAMPVSADISHLLLLMSLTFCVCIVYGTWRYR